MAMGGGTFVVLGTTLVAVLAVAAAVGADAVAGTPDETPAASETSAVSGDEFCEMAGEMLALAEERADAADAAEAAVMADSANLSEAEWLVALHAQGEAKQAFVDTFVSYSEQAAHMVPDPTVADAFAVSGRAGELVGTKMATLAREAESVEGYLASVLAVEADPEVVRARAEGADANVIIDAYLANECGIFPDGDD